MIKNSVNFFLRSKITKLVSENQSFKSFIIKSETYFNKNTCQFNKFGFSIRKNCSVPALKNVSYTKPVVLLSGILSFFGLQKPPEEPELIMRIKKGILFIQRGQFDKAEVMLHTALQLAQDENDEDGITYIHDLLANLAFELDQPSKAEKLFVNVLQRLLAKGEPQDSNKVVDISLKLAKIFQDMKQYEKAEQGFNFCIDTLDKKLEEGDEDTLALWGMSMDWYARFLLIRGKKSEALNCFKKAYEMCVKVNGIDHTQTVVLLNDLGTVSSLMGDHNSAMEYLEKAKKIGDKLPEMEDLASIYINLGQLYLLKEMYKESREACEQGLKKATAYKNEEAYSEAKQCLDNIKKVFQNPNNEKNLKTAPAT